jgi:acyl-[acyl-carrier-protein]-phospholipid O-acyltransferase/long-chain-fatty-acid--[acyl-carrier-protein] ligase
VPINALIQHRPPADRKGAVIAAANLLSFVGIALQPVVQYVMIYVGHPNPARVFLITAILTLGAAAYIVIMLPDSLLRLALWIATHSLYRLRVEGRDNIPETGGALFVASRVPPGNAMHCTVPLIEALLLMASTDRPIRFVMLREVYDLPLVRPIARLSRAIPIPSRQRPQEMLCSLREAGEAIQAGEVVCIFAARGASPAIERILKGVDATVVPVNVEFPRGNILSVERGSVRWKMPRVLPCPVKISFGLPQSPDSFARSAATGVYGK